MKRFSNGTYCLIASVALILVSCSMWDSNHAEKPVAMNNSSTVARYVSSLNLDHSPTSIVYYTEESNQAVQVDLNKWQTLGDKDSRWDLFVKTFYANTRTKSHSGLHHVGCFVGSADELRTKFFDFSNPANEISIIDPASFETSGSADGKLVGVTFSVPSSVNRPDLSVLRGHTWHFRLPHCTEGGKMPLLTDGIQLVSNLKDMKGERQPAGAKAWAPAPAATAAAPVVTPASINEDGFQIYDQVTGATNLPRFTLRGDYNKLQVRADDRPWQGADVSTKDGALKFALQMQEYFYRGMADQTPGNPDMNFYAQKNSVRDWCHMPWLNVGESGREAIHGLTKERDLNPSKNIYPNAPAGSDWGIGFYNAVGCKTLDKIFGSVGSLKNPAMQPGTVQFGDGTVSAKILFTTADFADLDGAFEWTANVSTPKSTTRAPQLVRHIQMDIAVKDSTIKGTLPQLANWVMITYYYDKNYQSPLNIPGLPDGLKHMRPMGVQYAFHQNGSIIFDGAGNNSNSGNLNGPADNPASTCLGCHGTAGTKVPMAPGFMDEASFTKINNQNLDFSQQLALAKRNYETRAKSKK